MDEIGRSDGHRLWRHMKAYFRHTGFGRAQRQRIVPQPFFVHSDLTPGIQIADMIAYILSWNVRLQGMDRPARPELDWLGSMVLTQYRQYPARDRSDVQANFVYFDDLRTRYERERQSLVPAPLGAFAAAGVSPN